MSSDWPLEPAGTESGACPVLGVQRLRRSFGAALAGLWWLVRREPNARIHVGLAALAVALALWLGLSPAEWALLVTLFGLVIGLEALNTAVERLADLAVPQPHPQVRLIKDLAAGGVLAAALAAAAAGVCLFGPRLLRVLG
jgi:diacylglycerol kinase